MDGVHDLGGKPGYGKVLRGIKHSDESQAPTISAPFAEAWEAKVFAMVASGALSAAWGNTDRFRHGVERIHPEAYLTHGYYGRWLGGVETLLIEAGIVTRQEIDQRAQSLGTQANDLVAAQPNTEPEALTPSIGARNAKREIDRAPVFQIGDWVLTNSAAVCGHTRLPAYVRDKRGLIVRAHGAWVFPDTNAHGQGENPQYLYTIAFASQSLWGKGHFTVHIDLFEPYINAI